MKNTIGTLLTCAYKIRLFYLVLNFLNLINYIVVLLCPCSQEIYPEVLRDKESQCLQLILKWFRVEKYIYKDKCKVLKLVIQTRGTKIDIHCTILTIFKNKKLAKAKEQTKKAN